MKKCFCGSPTTASRFVDDFRHEPIQICTTCGALQIAVEPDDEELDAFYSKDYSDARSEALTPEYEAVMRRRASAQLDFISTRGKIDGSSVLDFGCGYGALLDACKQAGATTTGYDADPRCMEHVASRHEVLESGNPEAWCDRRFDLILMSHILEHLNAPCLRLQNLRHHARQLFIEVPYYDANFAAQFEDTEGHLWFFNDHSVSALVESAGWRIDVLQRSGPGMNFYWGRTGVLRLGRRLLRSISRDWFFNQYGRNDNGMWIRILASAK